ncbi:hypothetical protein BKA57DRAFT_53142 [Linnemannia elongata]|nr:hypothetical protein BKA57DRAFT_53142 [Linnemannia elongata]
MGISLFLPFGVMSAVINRLAISSTKQVATCVRRPSHPVQALMAANALPRCATNKGCRNIWETGEGGTTSSCSTHPLFSTIISLICTPDFNGVK